MDLSKFTEKSQAALTEAQNIAARNEREGADSARPLKDATPCVESP